MMEIDFQNSLGVIPVIVQDQVTRMILKLGYMNESAYRNSQPGQQLMLYDQGEGKEYAFAYQGNDDVRLMELKKAREEQAFLALVQIEPHEGVEKSETDFGEINDNRLYFFTYLQDLIDRRRSEMPEQSYTTKLFNKGINKIAQKLGEEAIELVIEAKDEDNNLLLNESADLMYHMLVLMSEKGQRIEDIAGILQERHSG